MKFCQMLILSVLSFSAVAGHARACPDALSATPAARENPDLVYKIFTNFRQIEQFWRAEFAEQGWEYRELKLQTFSGELDSACGPISREEGPVYCRKDETVYLDYDWFRTEIGDRIVTDSFIAIVLAHEFGHHVQKLTGALSRAVRHPEELELGPIRYLKTLSEIQADCLSGYFYQYREETLGLDSRGLELDLAQLGRVRSADAPTLWFGIGRTAGNIDACEPFARPVLR